MAIDIDQPTTDPKTLKKQEQTKLWQELTKQKAINKQKKAEERKRVREEYIKQSAEIKKALNTCRDDIKNKLSFFKQQVKENKLERKEAKLQFNQYRKDRIQLFRLDEQKILNLTSDELKSNSRYRMKRWFFGVGKEFSRVSWVSGRQVWKDFVIIIIIVAVLALLFLGIDAILTAAGVIG